MKNEKMKNKLKIINGVTKAVNKIMAYQ